MFNVCIKRANIDIWINLIYTQYEHFRSSLHIDEVNSIWMIAFNNDKLIYRPIYKCEIGSSKLVKTFCSFTIYRSKSVPSGGQCFVFYLFVWSWVFLLVLDWVLRLTLYFGEGGISCGFFLLLGILFLSKYVNYEYNRKASERHILTKLNYVQLAVWIFSLFLSRFVS